MRWALVGSFITLSLLAAMPWLERRGFSDEGQTSLNLRYEIDPRRNRRKVLVDLVLPALAVEEGRARVEGAIAG